MNKSGNFWFFSGLIALLVWGIVIFLNLDEFSKVPPEGDFLVKIFIFSFIIGFIVFICAVLGKTSE
jgi:hypothetical protein